MPELPQTNLQLYALLLRRGWAADDLQSMAKAYDLALSLFACQVRPSGKPFICHLVGSAGAAAVASDEPDVSVASLLHAAYDFARWGDGLEGPAASRRQQLRTVIGDNAETLVFRYSTLGWEVEAVNELLARASSLPELDRSVVLMRLANEADDMADLGLRLSTKGDEPLHQPHAVAAQVALARALQLDYLADLLQAALRENEMAEVPAILRHSERGSYTLAPRSDTVHVVLRRALRRLGAYARYRLRVARRLL